MGCCFSKNDPCSKPVPSLSETHQNQTKNPQKSVTPLKLDQPKKQIAAIEANPKEGSERTDEEDEGKEVLLKKKKEVFVIQHRKSNDNNNNNKRGLDSDGSASSSSDPIREPEEIGRNLMAAVANGQAVRTSSCTKEEVDAILIQCGRLSRSSSGKGGNVVGHGRRYSGSKRSFDFDRENEFTEVNNDENDGDERLRRRRESRGSHRRRASLSRSRERDQTPQQQQQQQQRSGSRERSHSNGRRVSRSPGRRSESPIISHSGNSNGNSNSNGNGNGNVRPGKLVSVPATVTSLSVDKGNNGNGGDGGNGKRGVVKRNVGSPRSQSPARAVSPGRGANLGNGNGNGNGGQQGVSLSRNGSRKAEHSPYRRTPLNEIDINSLPFHPLSNKKGVVQKGKEIEEDVVVKQLVSSGLQQNKLTDPNNAKASATQGTHRRTGSRGAEGYEVTKTNYCRVHEHQTPNIEQKIDTKRGQIDPSEYDAVLTPVVISGNDTTLKLPQTLMRSRSGRRSRDLDISVDALLAPTPATNYNSLLLQDIHNFHQKSSNANAVSNNNNSATSNIDSNTPPFNLPACVSKAQSILEAVADLNSTTVGSNLKTPKEHNFSFQFNDPFVQTEVKVGDDLMEPSLHKYVTVRKRGGDMDGEESSGSNSFVGGGCHQNWVSSSSWEPNSADSSSDCWTSKSYSREEVSPVGFQRNAISDLGFSAHDDSERKSGKAEGARTKTGASRGPISASKPGGASV